MSRLSTLALSARGSTTVVILAAVLVHLPLALAGPNFILDDWYALGNAAFDGAVNAGGADQLRARPGAWLVYALEFGAIGRHPLPIYLLQSALNVGVAVVLLHLARRLVGAAPALAISVLWLVMPNHGSLENWASTLNIVLALLLLLVGCLLLTAAPTRRRTAVITLLLSCAVLSYEAVVPAALLAVILLPLARGRALTTAEVLPPAAGLLVASAWIVLNWHPYKEVRGWADLSGALPAHFGRGVGLPDGVGAAVVVVALVALTVSIIRIALPSFRHLKTPADDLVFAGAAVVLVGTLPFVRYYYVPIGVDDRVHVIAAIGAAMWWVGLGVHAWRHVPIAVAAAGVVVLGAMGSVNVQRDLLYAQAGQDVLDTFVALDEEFPSPDGPIMAGPLPLAEQNIVGLLDLDALQVHRGTRSVGGLVALDETTFYSAPEHLRFDQWQALRGRPPDSRGLTD